MKEGPMRPLKVYMGDLTHDTLVLVSDTIPINICQPRIHYEFFYTEEHMRARSDQFKRYGTDANALSKIVTRVSNIESLMRNVRTLAGEEVVYTDTDLDRFTRYTLAT